MQPLQQGVDYYIENGLYVFTEAYHLKRGYCCGSGCRHCPYRKVENKLKVAVSWSGGKDSAQALWYLLQDDRYQVVHLFTVFDKELRRVGLHGIPEHLIEQQAKAIGLHLKKLYLPSSEDHRAYEELMVQNFNELREEDIRHVMFGDIFLDDLKSYRDQMLEKAGLVGVYPIWKKDTEPLVRQFISLGFKTALCAANAKYFSSSALGSTINDNFLAQLPVGVDPGGENGEFHTFVFDGPIFKHPVDFAMGKVVQKTYEYKTINKEGEEEMQKTTFLFREFC
jgi:uncharacterized protein (TIGR00290 family)